MLIALTPSSLQYNSGIVRYHGVYTVESSTFIVMNLCKYGSLRKFWFTQQLSKHAKYGLLLQAAKILQQLHDANIVHKDLKDGNFLVDTNGKVFMSDLSSTAYNFLKDTKKQGTEAYMAPEVNQEYAIVTPKCDIYSFGKMLEQLGMKGNETSRIVVSYTKEKPEERGSIAEFELLCISVLSLYDNLGCILEKSIMLHTSIQEIIFDEFDIELAKYCKVNALRVTFNLKKVVLMQLAIDGYLSLTITGVLDDSLRSDISKIACCSSDITLNCPASVFVEIGSMFQHSLRTLHMNQDCDIGVAITLLQFFNLNCVSIYDATLSDELLQTIGSLSKSKLQHLQLHNTLISNSNTCITLLPNLLSFFPDLQSFSLIGGNFTETSLFRLLSSFEQNTELKSVTLSCSALHDLHLPLLLSSKSIQSIDAAQVKSTDLCHLQLLLQSDTLLRVKICTISDINTTTLNSLFTSANPNIRYLQINDRQVEKK